MRNLGDGAIRQHSGTTLGWSASQNDVDAAPLGDCVQSPDSQGLRQKTPPQHPQVDPIGKRGFKGGGDEAGWPVTGRLVANTRPNGDPHLIDIVFRQHLQPVRQDRRGWRAIVGCIDDGQAVSICHRSNFARRNAELATKRAAE